MQILLDYAVRFIQFIGNFFQWVLTAPQAELDYLLVIFIAIGLAGLLYTFVRNLKYIAMMLICLVFVFFLFRAVAII